MTTLRTRLLVPLLLALLGVFAASCGGSEDSATETDASSSDGAAESTDDDTAASTSSSDQSDQGDDAPGDDAADTGSADAYCRTKAEADALLDTVDIFDPEAVEAALRQNIVLIEEAIEIAPTEIRDDLRTIRASFDDYVAVLEENDWDIIASTDELDALDARPEPEAAEDRIGEWEDANCDFPDDATDGEDAMDDDPFANPDAFEAMLATDAGRALMIEGMTQDGELTADQAGCLLDNLDFESLSALANGDEPNPEVLGLMLDVAVVCGLEELFGLAETDEAAGSDTTADAELLEAMLATESGRALLIEGMIEDGQLSADQAGCLLDNLDMDTLVVLLNEEGADPPPDVIISMLELIDTCDLANLFAG